MVKYRGENIAIFSAPRARYERGEYGGSLEEEIRNMVNDFGGGEDPYEEISLAEEKAMEYGVSPAIGVGLLKDLWPRHHSAEKSAIAVSEEILERQYDSWRASVATITENLLRQSIPQELRFLIEPHIKSSVNEFLDYFLR